MRYRRADAAGGTYFFTVNLAERRSDVLVRHIDNLRAAKKTMGNDYWSYGVKNNRPTLETFLRHHHSQGLSSAQMSVDEIFHPSTYESYSI